MGKTGMAVSSRIPSKMAVHSTSQQDLLVGDNVGGCGDAQAEAPRLAKPPCSRVRLKTGRAKLAAPISGPAESPCGSTERLQWGKMFDAQLTVN